MHRAIGCAHLPMTTRLTIDSESIHDMFQSWHMERQSLDAELSESVAALAAYQANLDSWQKALSSEREELRVARDRFERDRADVSRSQSAASDAMATELQAAREKITALTTLLLNRTEELRTLDNRRAEIQTELELERAKEKELKVALDDQKRSIEQQRSEWAEELRQLRELLQRQLETPHADLLATAADGLEPASAPTPTPVHVRPETSETHAKPRDNPVVGSIVQQFDKLRQQRAVGRQAIGRGR
jgi:chromosome segregation ATPase